MDGSILRDSLYVTLYLEIILVLIIIFLYDFSSLRISCLFSVP